MKKKRPLVVNFIGAPGAGKSTLAAAVFAKLKMHGISCELVDEYVKGAVWENRMKIIKNQLYLLAKQYQKIARVSDSVDIIITDSPVVLGIYYNRRNAPDFDFDEKIFAPLVLNCYNAFNNLNFFVKRHYKYEAKGRYQSEEEAKNMEKELINLNKQYNIKSINVISSEKTADEIAEKLVEYVKNKKEEK